VGNRAPPPGEDANERGHPRLRQPARIGGDESYGEKNERARRVKSNRPDECPSTRMGLNVKGSFQSRHLLVNGHCQYGLITNTEKKERIPEERWK